MPVKRERRGPTRVAQSSLHGHDVDPCRDELAGDKVTQVVNPHTGQSKALAVAPPPQRHGTGGQRRVAERVRPPNVTVGWDRHPGGKQRFALHAPQRAQEPKRFGGQSRTTGIAFLLPPKLSAAAAFRRVALGHFVRRFGLVRAAVAYGADRGLGKAQCLWRDRLPQKQGVSVIVMITAKDG